MPQFSAGSFGVPSARQSTGFKINCNSRIAFRVMLRADLCHPKKGRGLPVKHRKERRMCKSLRGKCLSLEAGAAERDLLPASPSSAGKSGHVFLENNEEQ